MTWITSVELNYLVFRYLQESGFTHSAFALGYEASIHKCTIDGNMVPPGALVTFVQKGLQYLEMEANLSNASMQTDADVDDDFSFLEPLDLITKNVSELKQIIKEKKQNQQKDKDKSKEPVREFEREHVHGKDREKFEKEKEAEKLLLKTQSDREQEKHNGKICDVREDTNIMKVENVGINGGTDPMDISPTSSTPEEFARSDLLILEGHTSEVCACAWCPTGRCLASGSGDSTARIWTIDDVFSSAQSSLQNVIVLKHAKARPSEKSKDVTTLDWNCEGTLLATGSYDGQARIWDMNGVLKGTLIKHKGPIFSLKWNKKADYLITGSCDKTAILWDMKNMERKQQFEFHSGPILDVDWRNSTSFATSSADNTISFCKVGENNPIKTFTGHKGEVNCVKWDPSGSLLASCSDDNSVKIWSLTRDEFVHDLKEHSKEIYTVRWSPARTSSNNPNQLVIASASCDSTVKLWDVEAGKLLCSLNGHRAPVYSIAFSPNGEYLASGSFDRSLIVWSVKDGKIVKTYNGSGGIFEVCWNNTGDKIAASFSSCVICVMNFRM